MSNNVLSKEQIIEEEINLKKFDFRKANEYMAYPVLLLEMASRYGLIPENSRNEIFERIMTAVEIKAENDILAMSNIVYILSKSLQERFSNYEALQKLLEVKTPSEAFKLVDEATEWFSFEIYEAMKSLMKCSEAKQYINDKSINDSFEHLYSVLKNLKTFALVNASVNLKSLHSSREEIRYMLFKRSKRGFYLDQLKDDIISFALEVKLIERLKVKDVMLEFYQKATENDEEDREKRHRVLLEKLEKEQKAIEEERINALEELQIAKRLEEERTIELEQKFEEEHPEYIDEEELEMAFDEYYSQLPAETLFLVDEIKVREEIEETYKKKKNRVLKEIEEIEENFAHETISYEVDRDMLIEVSLVNFIKEYGLFSLAQKGVIQYPADLSTKVTELNELSLNKAVKEFFESDFKLTQKEKEYFLS